MNAFLKILFLTAAVSIASYLLDGVHVDSPMVAIIAAIVLALLNTFLKPLLILFTLPVTLLTFGLFLLVINVIIIFATAAIVPGFEVDGFWWALIFSFLVSIINSFLENIDKKSKEKKR